PFGLEIELAQRVDVVQLESTKPHQLAGPFVDVGGVAHADSLSIGRLAKKTYSLPGRSGASRTSRTSNPQWSSERVTSSQLRNRSVAVDVSVDPSARNKTELRNVTSGQETPVPSSQV